MKLSEQFQRAVLNNDRTIDEISSASGIPSQSIRSYCGDYHGTLERIERLAETLGYKVILKYESR